MIYVKALKADFEEAGIEIKNERKVDEKHIKHVEHLTAAQMNYIRHKAKYEFIDQIPIQEGD